MANVTTRTQKEKVKGKGTREPTEFEKFRELTRRIVAVPKSEVDKATEKWKRKKH